MLRHTVALVFSLAGAAAPAPGQQPPDRQAVLATVKAFRDAMSRGDSLGVLQLLAPDVTVLESGGLETFAEFRAHHLVADIAFARAVASAREEPVVTVLGDVAWVAGTSRNTGTFRDRPVNSAAAELMVLTRVPDGWRIRAIHWSSRTIRTP